MTACIYIVETAAMNTTAQRWGNSLAVRIPAGVARETGLTHGSAVQLAIESGRIVLTPMRSKPRFDIDKLVAKITPRNLPSQDVWGAPIGKEVW